MFSRASAENIHTVLWISRSLLLSTPLLKASWENLSTLRGFTACHRGMGDLARGMSCGNDFSNWRIKIKMRFGKNRRRGGFTLVEIMIVVLIIGILLAIAVPNFISARERSRTQSCIANLRQIDAAKEQWAMAENAPNGAAVAWGDLVPDYIQNQPACPASGNYTLNNVGTDPTCSEPGHQLP
jgi:prepilin-type N-terminal cleavage/methylation domain-containing protein